MGTQKDANSDSVHYFSLPERFMWGVWLALEDFGPDAGPPFNLLESHCWPFLINSMIGQRSYGAELHSAPAPFTQGRRALCEALGATQEPFYSRAKDRH